MGETPHEVIPGGVSAVAAAETDAAADPKDRAALRRRRPAGHPAAAVTLPGRADGRPRRVAFGP
ncbi:hypothetical protein [Micromonospora sp. MH33]|uniref:hypothetical protein n=1 Tax=Micromonospora sp. MH33 TaxID=1945509 RepID=UPI0011B27EE8|nr:hypothetical protein [Micromonospora sp. MH33]